MIDSFRLFNSFDCCNNIAIITFWFSIIYYLYSISIIHTCVWHFVTGGACYMVLAFLTASQIFVHPLLRLSFSLSVFSRRPHPQWRVWLSTVYEPLADTDIHAYVRVARGTISCGPTSFCGFYDVRPTGSRFRSRWQVSDLHGAIQATVKTVPSVATRIAPRSSVPDKALPSLPSCLSSLLAVACCHFTSPFCECANSTRRLLSLL